MQITQQPLLQVRYSILADGERLSVSKFYFSETQMLDIGEIDQNGPVAECEAPLRQHSRQLGNSYRGFDWSPGELEPCPTLPGFHIDNIGGRQLALPLFRGQQDLFFLAKGFVAVQQSFLKLRLLDRLCQITGGGDLVSP